MIIIRIGGLETVIYVCGKYPRPSVYGHQIICQFLALQYCDLKTRKIEFKCDRRKNEGPKAQVFLSSKTLQYAFWRSGAGGKF